jgi:hypothetical protein
MSALDTVADYISDARTLLQDIIAPFRYDDASLLVAFNVTLLETRRVRPELFVFRHHEHVPSFTVVDTEPVEMEHPFRLALVYGTCAHALARDQEDVQDARSAQFLRIFYEMLLGLRVLGLAPQPQGAG